MLVPDTPSTPSSSASPAMDNPSFPFTPFSFPSFLAELRARSNNRPPIPKGPPMTIPWTTLHRLRSRKELDLDDIEECALALNDPRTSDGFLFTPKLFQALGDNPCAVWYGRHTLFIVGESGCHSLLHWDRCDPHYIAHFDPLKDRVGFTCPPQVQSLVKSTFHRDGCPDLPIKTMECDKSGSIDSASYSLCFAQALLRSQKIPPRVLTQALINTIENFHNSPAPPTSNAVQMRPIRRSATGPLEWSMPDEKVSSTSSTEPCPVPPYPSDREGPVLEMTTSPMPGRDSPFFSRSATPDLPATLGGEEDVRYPYAPLPFSSTPTDSGAVPGTSPTDEPSSKGKEPAMSSTNDLSTQDKELEAGATKPPSAKGNERQVSWQERWCDLLDIVNNLEAQEKLAIQLLALKDDPPLLPPLLEDESVLEEAFNKFAADENDALIANGKEPRYTSFKEFMFAGVNQHFEAKVSEAKFKVSEMIEEVTEAAKSKGQSIRQCPEFHEMMSILGKRRRPSSPSLFAKILQYYQESLARRNSGPSAKGKERQDPLFEEVMAEYTEKDLAFAKMTSEAKVASAAVLLAQNRIDGVDFDLSELKKVFDGLSLTQEELTKVCDKASFFVSELLRDCIIDRGCRVDQAEKEMLVVDIYLKRMRGRLTEELKRLQKEEKAKNEAKREITGQYINAVTKKGFLDDARDGFLADRPLSKHLVENMEGLFGSREFLSYVAKYDSYGRVGNNDNEGFSQQS